jgi:hypothetical protein
VRRDRDQGEMRSAAATNPSDATVGDVAAEDDEVR